jgi:hypothetical protein
VQKRHLTVAIPLVNSIVRKTADPKALVPRSACAWVCLAALALLIPASRHGIATSTPEISSVLVPSLLFESASSPHSAFRLGDAARPFAWSTAIGDFNTDGKPDVAIADHAGHRASGYEYRIELSISGQAPDDVTFESAHDAVTISLSDVDRDNDLDIVVGVPLSAETVGVWLNDGHGHFSSGDVRQFPAALQAHRTLESGDSVVDLASFDVSPRRADKNLSVAFRAPPSRAADRLPVSHAQKLPSRFVFGRTSPRAPPNSTSDLLS